jgi:hypothetical protein
MIINPSKFSVRSTSKSCIGIYEPAESYEFEEFGIFEVSDFLAALNSLKSPSIEVNDKFLTISDGKQKFKYFTTAKDLLPVVTINLEKVNAVDFDLDFDLPAEKLNILMQSANIVKASKVFFETSKKKIIITVAEELDSSSNSFEISIEEGIEKNSLAKPVCIPISDLKLHSGDYTVKISPKISKWTNLGCKLDYYIGVLAK